MKKINASCVGQASLDYINSQMLVRSLVDSVDQGKRDAVFDAHGVGGMSALLIGCMAETAKALERRGGSLLLVNVSPELFATLPPLLKRCCLSVEDSIYDEPVVTAIFP